MALYTFADPAPSPSPEPIPEEEEYYSSWSLFLVCLLLILSLWTSYYLQIKRIRAIHETLVSIVAGMFVGFVVRLAPGHLIREMLTFRHTLFFNLLLPPIILNCGYELKQESFFRNFGSILIFAFLGTFISAVGLGVLVYIWHFLGLESLNLTLLECLIFGSTLSATDPVTILAIFNQYKVDPKLYNIIFGESLLNDAVSIVMYETLSRFHGTEIYVRSLFVGVGMFLLSFSVSMALGIAFGLFVSLTLKHSSLALFPKIESCLVALCAYTCYFFSNGLSIAGISMSGIVSLLFCGITLKHYAYHTMSRRTQRATKYIFSILAQLSENFIFIYLGLSLFTSPPSSKVTSYFKPLFIIISTVSVIFVRYAAVFPLSEAINLFQRHVRGQRADEIPYSYQIMLFWAGLRGAVGVALAAGFQGENAQTLRTTVLVVVVLTVVLFGGTTARMLEVLGIRTGVEDDGASSDEDDAADAAFFGGSWYNRRNGSSLWDRYRDDDVSAHPPNNRVRNRAAQYEASLYNHHAQNTHTRRTSGSTRYGGDHVYPYSGTNPNPHAIFSASSSEYDSDNGEVLPLASPPPTRSERGPAQHDIVSSSASVSRRSSGAATPQGNGEEGKWFQALDERYLLPLFSNATASRTFHARRQRRSASGNVQGGTEEAGGRGTATGTPLESEDEGTQEVDLRESARGVRNGVESPWIATARQSRIGSPALRSPRDQSDGKFGS